MATCEQSSRTCQACRPGIERDRGLCATNTGDEAGVRGMDVEHPELAGSGVPEPMDDANWRGDVGSRASQYCPIADDELGCAFENVEGVDLVCVGMGLDAFELRPEMELDYLELRQLGEDPVEARAARGSLALPWADGDSVHSSTVSVRPAACATICRHAQRPDPVTFSALRHSAHLRKAGLHAGPEAIGGFRNHPYGVFSGSSHEVPTRHRGRGTRKRSGPSQTRPYSWRTRGSFPEFRLARARWARLGRAERRKSDV